MASQCIEARATSAGPKYEVRDLSYNDLAARWPGLEAYLLRSENVPLSRHPAWLLVLQEGLRHIPYCLEATEDERTCGFLALAYVRSLIFGRVLVSLPYVNYGGIVAKNDLVMELLIDRAVKLADQLKVRYLELRHERPLTHPALAQTRTDKVHMRLALPTSSEQLWAGLQAKVRNQVRKGRNNGLTVAWGGRDSLAEFYAVFSENMRDLGTPVYGRRLFESILDHFPEQAEFCIVHAGAQPLACALLLHGWGITEVPSASSLRSHKHTCANMLMYWELLKRAVDRKQQWFDFGRSSRDSNTFRFKKQWGAEPFLAEWQYYVRQGDAADLRTENPRYQRFIKLWQRLPVPLTRLIGPSIVRGIP